MHCCKMHLNLFSVGAPQLNPLVGAYDTPCDPLVGWGGQCPLSSPSPLPLDAYNSSPSQHRTGHSNSFDVAPSTILHAPPL